MRSHLLPLAMLAGASALLCGTAEAAGGPLGIDHKISYDNRGIWKRSNQLALEDFLIASEFAGALWEGGESRVGKTLWQSIDATALGGVSAEALKLAFSRARPSQTDDPNDFFAGRGHKSFPSGEVTNITAIITPFVLEYGPDEPIVYALELLPIYDSVARMKAHAHWQSDVIAGFALGSLAGWYAHSRSTPLILGVLPHGFTVGLREEFGL